MGILTINGTDIEDLGLEPVGLGSAWSAPRIERTQTGAIARVGVRPAVVARGAAKTVPLALDLPSTVSARRAALDTVLWHLDGVLELVWSDATDRAQYARCPTKEIRASFEQVAYVTGDLEIQLSLVLDTPFSLDLYSRTVAWAADGTTALELGTGTAAPVVEIPGPVSSDVTIEYSGITGEVLSSVVLSGSGTWVAADESLIIDCGRERIWVSDGVTVTADLDMSLYSSGSFPVFDPGDGDVDGTGCTVGASHAGHATYRRSWE